MTLNETRKAALLRRARKVGADKAVVAKYLEIVGESFIKVCNGNSNSWTVGHVLSYAFDAKVPKEDLSQYRLTVITTRNAAGWIVTTSLNRHYFAGLESRNDEIAKAERIVGFAS